MPLNLSEYNLGDPTSRMDCYEAILRRQRHIEEELWNNHDQGAMRELHDENEELRRMLQAVTRQAHRSIAVSHVLEGGELDEPLLPTAARKPAQKTASCFFACFPCL